MSHFKFGDERNCRNCQQPIYFGGSFWWHKHNDSGYCFKNDALDQRQSEPDLDETERVRAAAPELLEALKACHLQMLQSNNDSEYAQEANQMAIAAIAKAVSK